jgi:hypothetical protein
MCYIFIGGYIVKKGLYFILLTMFMAQIPSESMGMKRQKPEDDFSSDDEQEKKRIKREGEDSAASVKNRPSSSIITTTSTTSTPSDQHDETQMQQLLEARRSAHARWQQQSNAPQRNDVQPSEDSKDLPQSLKNLITSLFPKPTLKHTSKRTWSRTLIFDVKFDENSFHKLLEILNQSIESENSNTIQFLLATQQCPLSPVDGSITFNVNLVVDGQNIQICSESANEANAFLTLLKHQSLNINTSRFAMLINRMWELLRTKPDIKQYLKSRGIKTSSEDLPEETNKFCIVQ